MTLREAFNSKKPFYRKKWESDNLDYKYIFFCGEIHPGEEEARLVDCLDWVDENNNPVGCFGYMSEENLNADDWEIKGLK